MIHIAVFHSARRLLLLGSVAALAACAEPAAPETDPSSALLITLDTTRADALSCYGAPAGLTPALDRLAAEGTRFDAAYAVAPLTLPSHASMLTGLYPPRHTLRNNGVGALPEEAETLAELARDAGYQTAAFIAAVVIDEAFGLDQGFETYGAPRRTLHRESVDYAERSAAEVVDEALAWFRARETDRPFFVWVHLFDPHGPHRPPPAFRHHSSAYLGEVAAMDHEIGRLLAPLRDEGTLAHTTVLVVGDHGEGLGDHGEISHGTYCYQPTLRVPMILRRPDGLPALSGNGVVSVADVHPTLAAAMGLDPAPSLDGVDLLGAEGAEGRDTRGVYFETYYGYLSFGWSPITGWVDGEGKYLHSSEPEFYDLTADPAESRNLADARPEAIERSREAIRAVAARPRLHRSVDEETDPRLLAQIRRLGYAEGGAVEGTLPEPLEDRGLPSPRRGAREDNEFRRAEALVGTGKNLGESERVLREILRANPRHAMARDLLGRCLMLQGRTEEALGTLLEVLDQAPPWPQTHLNVAICLTQLGRVEDSLPYLRNALEIDPHHAKSLGNLAFALEELGRREEAAPHRRRFEELTGKPLPPRR